MTWSGETIKSDIVVCNSDTMWTYKNLIAPQLPQAAGPTAASSESRHSMSLFVWYFGTNRALRRRAPSHDGARSSRYEELLRDIFKRHKLAEDFSLYLHRPSSHRPLAWRQTAATRSTCSRPVPHLASGTDWADARRALPAAPFEARPWKATVLPGLSRAHRQLAHHHAAGLPGPVAVLQRCAAFGQEPLLLQSAWFRAAQPKRRRRWSLHGGGRHPPRCRCAGGADVGQDAGDR